MSLKLLRELTLRVSWTLPKYRPFIRTMADDTERTQTPIIFAPETYQYDKFSLDKSQLARDPIEQFTKWFDEVKNDKSETLPEAITFSSAELPSGRVSSRVLLFKELDHRGFVVYSNWGTSKKARDIQSNPYAAINFFWKDLQRQVRIEGFTEHVNRETSERYFKVRPRGSKIGAWSSPQSSRIESRDELDQLTEENTKRFEGQEDIPCPDYWGGLRIVPLDIEFWQGRPSRLHDRFAYRRKNEHDEWEILRLAP